MKKDMIVDFKMPRYSEIPNVGLYLKQVVRLINEALEPPFRITVTETMLGNYVKKHMITNPVKKQYDREQIAGMIFIVLAKTVISLEQAELLLNLQREEYPAEMAYEYFCRELENALLYVYGYKEGMDVISEDNSEAKSLLRNVIITMAHKFYLDDRFLAIDKTLR